MRHPFCRSVALLACAALGGCSALSESSAPPALEGSAWILSSLPGAELSRDAPATLRFEGGRALGSDGCNRFSVAYVTRGATIEFPSSAATTRMSCPPEVMKQADVYLLALSGAQTYRVEGGQLQLLGPDRAVRAAFIPQAQALAGTRWRATSVNNGRGAVVSLLPNSNLTLAFAADGQLSGSAGCNQYRGSYRAEGGKLRITSTAATRETCPDRALMSQEDAYLRALQGETSVRFEADRLELRSNSGAVAAVFTRDAGG